MTDRTLWSATALVLYVGLIVLSNYLLEHFGLIGIGFGLAAPAGTFCAALTFPARDVVQRFGGFWLGAASVLLGAAISWWISPTLAVASAVAYLVGESTDLLVYSALQRHFVFAVLSSGVVASLVTSVVFLHLAHIPWSAAGPGLLVVKWAMQGASLPATFWLRKVLPRKAMA